MSAMLRVRPFRNAVAAKEYYNSSLAYGDYYAKDAVIQGLWQGKAAKRLGLSETVEGKDFNRLADNRHPLTDEPLTPRTKTDRIVAYDFNFHPPKSVSILYAFTKSEQMLEAFRQSVGETMSEMEALAQTRVRRGGSDENRTTGNLVWAQFIHQTARPVDGIPDPHLHAHCFTFNATFDEVEGRFKAGNFVELKRHAPYFEAAVHARFARRLADMGFGIATNQKGGWEITGIPREMIEKYSRRTSQIDDIARARNITDAAVKDAIGASTRQKKNSNLTEGDLLAAWAAKLGGDEQQTIREVLSNRGSHRPPEITPSQAVDFALNHAFERASVVHKRQIAREALRYGVGSVSPEAVLREIERRPLIRRTINGQELCTTHQVMREERKMVAAVRRGKNQHSPMAPKHYATKREYLSEEQRAAVRHVLESRDQVIAVRGGAGVGKTTAMQEVVEAIRAGGREVYAFAPSAAASRDTLREAGFKNADTVAKLRADPDLQERVKGGVIWIDEAGMVGVRDLLAIQEIAGSDTRIILTGDERQHGPVARGDAFRILQSHAGLKPATIYRIRRQENQLYRNAVSDLSEGQIDSGLQKLKEYGALKEIPDDEERYAALAADYASSIRSDKFPFVVSPSHAESRTVTAAIRRELTERGRLRNEREFEQLDRLQLTDAEKQNARLYQPGQIVQFNQNLSGFKRGSQARVQSVDDKGQVILAREGAAPRPLDLSKPDRFDVFEKKSLTLAEGDRIRITRNGRSLDKRRISNGQLYTIQGFTKEGNIKLNTGGVLAKDHGHLAYGYCSTSYSAQSKSTDPVFIAQSSLSRGAASREQIYVSVSRGKSRIAVYTDDVEGLKQSVRDSSSRQAALDVFDKVSDTTLQPPTGEPTIRPPEMPDSPQPNDPKRTPSSDQTPWRERVPRTGKPKAVTWQTYTVGRRQMEASLVRPGNMNWTEYVRARRHSDGGPLTKPVPDAQHRKPVQYTARRLAQAAKRKTAEQPEAKNGPDALVGNAKKPEQANLATITNRKKPDMEAPPKQTRLATRETLKLNPQQRQAAETRIRQAGFTPAKKTKLQEEHTRKQKAAQKAQQVTPPSPPPKLPPRQTPKK